jgi:hypothetical protein
MIYRLLADATLLLHLAYILFVMLGGLAVLRWPRLAWMHLPAVLWGAWIEFTDGLCPLTPLENMLRRQGGEAGYGGGFIEHYLAAMIYPDGLARTVQIVLGALVLLVNSAFYQELWRQKRSIEQQLVEHKPANQSSQ